MKQVETNPWMFQNYKDLINAGKLNYDGIVTYSMKQYVIRLKPELTVETSRSIRKCELDKNVWIATDRGMRQLLDTELNLLYINIKF